MLCQPKQEHRVSFNEICSNLQPSLGGGIMAHNISRAELDSRVKKDPFVAQNIVSAEIIEIKPSKTDARLAFLNG